MQNSIECEVGEKVVGYYLTMLFVVYMNIRVNLHSLPAPRALQPKLYSFRNLVDLKPTVRQIKKYGSMQCNLLSILRTCIDRLIRRSNIFGLIIM
jgi:hypothetical protein